MTAKHTSNICWYPAAWSRGTKGCRLASSGQDTGSISLVAFSFIVQEPSAIMECASDRSRFSCARHHIFMLVENIYKDLCSGGCESVPGA